MQSVLFNAANSVRYPYLSPLGLLDEVEELVRNVSVYEFLKQETLPGGFHDNKKFIELTRSRLVDLIDDDVRGSMGLIEEAEYARLFDRYVTHVTNWIRKEKVRNPSTGRLENADEEMMREVERTLDVGSRKDEFRHDVISKIGAWSLDHPNRRPDYGEIFPDYFKKIREAYFQQQRKVVRRGIDELLVYLAGDQTMQPEALQRAEKTVQAMVDQRGYSKPSARDAIMLLRRQRYPE
jgi:predicted Ser/Thr protein kinase